MNTLQRPLFDAPMPMVEGSGITSMAMDEAAGEQIGAELTAAIAQGVADTENAIDAADDNVGIMNALRGKQASEEDYRTELAGYVGRKDANATPDSVLALVQPTMAMIELGDAPMGGIADMMTPQTLGVEEEVFGKLPVQKLKRGGIVSDFRALQALRGSFLPSQEEIAAAYAPQQMSPFQTALAVGAPFVQGLLAPSDQGGGINAALAAASQAAAQQLAAQREQKTKSDLLTKQALMEQQIKTGDFALAEALKRSAAAREAASKERIAASKGQGADSPIGKLLADKAAALARGDTEQANIIQAQIDIQNTAKTPPLTIGQMMLIDRENLLNKNAEKAITELVDPISKQVEQLGKIDNLLGTVEGLSDIARAGPAGEFKNKIRKTVLFVRELVPEAADLFESFTADVLSGDEMGDDLITQDAAARALMAANAQLVLAFTQYFPGNLNREELRVAMQAAAGDLDRSPESVRLLRKIYNKTLTQVRSLDTGFRKIRLDFLKESRTNKELNSRDLLARLQKFQLEKQAEYRLEDGAEFDPALYAMQQRDEAAQVEQINIRTAPLTATSAADTFTTAFRTIAEQNAQKDRRGNLIGNALESTPEKYLSEGNLAQVVKKVATTYLQNRRDADGKTIQFDDLSRDQQKKLMQYVLQGLTEDFGLQDQVLPGSDKVLKVPTRRTLITVIKKMGGLE